MLEGLAGNKLKTLALACLEAIRLAWHDLEEKGTPADKFLADFFRANHKYGSRDRHAITSSVFAFFRWKGCLEKLFDIDRENIPGPALSAALAADDPSCPVFPFWCDVAPDVLAAMTDPFKRIRTVTNNDMDLDPYDLVPDWMPAGIFISTLPSMVGASMVSPSAACTKDTGISSSTSCPSRLKSLCSFTRTVT